MMKLCFDRLFLEAYQPGNDESNHKGHDNKNKAHGEAVRIITGEAQNCHAPAHLGAYIPRAMDELKDAGFKYICTFDRMKPTFHKL